jgi:hypothetical protein
MGSLERLDSSQCLLPENVVDGQVRLRLGCSVQAALQLLHVLAASTEPKSAPRRRDLRYRRGCVGRGIGRRFADGGRLALEQPLDGRVADTRLKLEHALDQAALVGVVAVAAAVDVVCGWR